MYFIIVLWNDNPPCVFDVSRTSITAHYPMRPKAFQKDLKPESPIFAYD